MKKTMQSNTIYAGVGSDLREVLETIRKEQDKSNISNVVIQMEKNWFVDPSISKHIKLNNVERIPLEAFIRNKILTDHTFFNNATIIADRMIEHISVQELSLILLPMLCDLVRYCHTKVILTFPDLDKITSKLNDLNINLFEHQLCNIEAIAFGDHKTLLSKDSFYRMIVEYARGLEIEFTDVEMDNKNFYTRATIVSGPENDFSIELNNENLMRLKFIELDKDVQEFSYKLEEKLETALMLKETSLKTEEETLDFKTYKHIRKLEKLADNLNYCFRYVNVSKLYDLCKNGYTKYQFKHIYHNDVVNELITRESRFERLEHPSIQLLNEIDPLYGWYSFKKVI